MRPGSIYAAFGSKEGLFKEALQYYAQQGSAQLDALIISTGSPLKGLKAFIEIAVIDSQSCAPSGMCMLSKTLSELTDENAELLAEAKRLLNSIENRFAETLIQAQNAGEISKEKNTQQLAAYLQVQIMGLRSYASINKNNKVVADMIDTMFASL
jgi:AcrR family transcriptional regulator